MRESSAFRRTNIHQTLGGGSVADVLLWRKWHGSVMLLISSTALWLLFTGFGYNPLSFVANVLLLLVIILFFWAKAASLLNRPLPPIPDLEVSDKTVEEVADVVRVWVNRLLAVAHAIAVCGNLRVLLQVSVSMWLIALIGSLCSFITFVYTGILLALSVPVLYEKYQDQIDANLFVVYTTLDPCYRKLDQFVLRRIPVSLYKQKKTQ